MTGLIDVVIGDSIVVEALVIGFELGTVMGTVEGPVELVVEMVVDDMVDVGRIDLGLFLSELYAVSTGTFE